MLLKKQEQAIIRHLFNPILRWGGVLIFFGYLSESCIVDSQIKQMNYISDNCSHATFIHMGEGVNPALNTRLQAVDSIAHCPVEECLISSPVFL